MITREVHKESTAMDYLGYALYAFGGLGIEILFMMVETNLWGLSNNKWTIHQNMIHWGITCIVWGIFSIILLKKSIKIHIDVKDINWFGVSALVLCSIMYTSYVWEGFKPIIEFSNNGVIKFAVQYIYYAFESMLILLIIAHGQKAFETLLKRSVSLPIGGILLAITCGLIHVFTQGIYTGIYTCIQSILFGIVYLLLNKDIVEERMDYFYKKRNKKVNEVLGLLKKYNYKLIGKVEHKEVVFSLNDVYYFESVDKKTFAYLKDKVLRIEDILLDIENLILNLDL